MSSEPNCDDNGTEKMVIMATSEGVHCSENVTENKIGEKKKDDFDFIFISCERVLRHETRTNLLQYPLHITYTAFSKDSLLPFGSPASDKC